MRLGRPAATSASRKLLTTLTANVYTRSSDIDTFNGDDSDFEECEDTPGFICEVEDNDEELPESMENSNISSDVDKSGKNKS